MISKRILIVDDEEKIIEVVKICLTKLAKWDAITATSGQEGIRKAITEQPDAILLDISMPGMDGIETLQKLQSNPKTEAIPVIFLTAQVQLVEQLQCEQIGITGLIAKPFDPMMISKEISQLLNWN